jgi:hypothetical protein
MTVKGPNTLAGRIEKRAEIAGRISHTRAALRQLIIDLDHGRCGDSDFRSELRR